MITDLASRLREEAVEAKLAGKLEEAEVLEFFNDMLQALTYEPRSRAVSGGEPMRTWITRAALSHGVVAHSEEDHEKYCTCERCPHCGEVIDDY